MGIEPGLPPAGQCARLVTRLPTGRKNAGRGTTVGCSPFGMVWAVESILCVESRLFGSRAITLGSQSKRQREVRSELNALGGGGAAYNTTKKSNQLRCNQICNSALAWFLRVGVKIEWCQPLTGLLAPQRCPREPRINLESERISSIGPIKTSWTRWAGTNWVPRMGGCV